VVNKKSYNTPNSDPLIFIHICNFITKKWIHNRQDSDDLDVSMTNYANQCDLATSTITKIANPPEGYKLPLKTIIKICRKEEMPLSQFFIDFEKEYGNKY
jgi:hypothetical protein